MLSLIFFFSDVDECSSELDVCVSEANCSNTEGGFSCQCPFGYIGDGRSDGNGCAGPYPRLVQLCDSNR